MNHFTRLTLAGSAVVLASCGPGRSGPSPAAGTLGWSGSFRQQTMAASSVIGPATPTRAASYGSIMLTPVEGQAGNYKVELSMSAPVDPNTHLAWALFSGPCGTPSPSVVGLNEFPMIEFSSGGGSVHAVMGLPLDPHGAYHANVYWAARASDVSNVMMCANLALNG